jgi:hypothetical protein
MRRRRRIPEADGATTTVEQERLPKPQTVALGAFVGCVGLLLVALLISVWPAVEKATSMRAAQATTNVRMSFLGVFHMHVTAGTSLLILVAVVGALGSFIHAATSFVEYAGNRRLTRSWTWWYVLRIPIGSSLALVMYFALRGGLFATNASAGDVNAYGIAALAGVAGLFSKQATAKLEEIFSTIFRVPPGRGDERLRDSLEHETPVVSGIEPAKLTTGSEVTLEVRGSGFIEASQVRLKRLETGEVLERKATFVNNTRVHVALAADELAEPGKIEITVVNPPPGGGTSRPIVVDVDPPKSRSRERD